MHETDFSSIGAEKVSGSIPNESDSKTKKEEKELDEEGLLKNGYDVILCGTGLVQSILASALARVGKTILHCDCNDFYGELDAVLSLGDLMKLTSEFASFSGTEGVNFNVGEKIEQGQTNEAVSSNAISLHPRGSFSTFLTHSATHLNNSFSFQVGIDLTTPYGLGTIVALPSQHKDASLVVQLHTWKMTDGKSPMAYFGYSDQEANEEMDGKSIARYYAQNYNVIPLTSFQYQRHVLSCKRSYALDFTPGLLYATGDAVAGLIASGVSESCEFKSLLGLYLFMEETKGKTFASGGRMMETAPTIKNKSTPNETNGGTKDNVVNQKGSEAALSLSRVPCSKGDVFQTKLLTPVDKRRLMKFLQLASDYAAARNSSSKSTRDTKSCESKNEEYNNDEKAEKEQLEEEVVTSLNERQLQQGRSLYRPQNKTVATSDLEVLQQCILDGMDFNTYLEQKHKLTDRLRSIVIHAMAMGSYSSDESAYSAKEGMNDLCKHLQSLGRYGRTAFLVPLYGAGELSQSFCRSAAVHGGTYLLRRGGEKVLLSDEDSKSVSGIMLGGNPHDECSESKPIYSKNVVVSSDALLNMERTEAPKHQKRRIMRRVSILRGKLIRNGSEDLEQRYLIIIPPDSIGNKNVIHGVVIDESVNVSPWNNNGGCILHLTTVIDDMLPGQETEEAILEKTAEVLLTSSSESQMSRVEELCHTSYSYKDNSCFNSSYIQQINGLHVCTRQGQSITVDTAFREAKNIFESICPHQEFLQLSDAMDDVVNEINQGHSGDEDHEGMMLESAMDMMKLSKTGTKEL